MARYIDADIAKKLWSGEHPTQLAMRKIFEELPTADVVPRSEVKKLQESYNNQLEKDIQTNADFVKYAKTEVAREIFEEIESMLIRYTFEDDYISLGITDELAELKKKYTEGKMI